MTSRDLEQRWPLVAPHEARQMTVVAACQYYGRYGLPVAFQGPSGMACRSWRFRSAVPSVRLKEAKVLSSVVRAPVSTGFQECRAGRPSWSSRPLPPWLVLLRVAAVRASAVRTCRSNREPCEVISPRLSRDLDRRSSSAGTSTNPTSLSTCTCFNTDGSPSLRASAMSMLLPPVAGDELEDLTTAWFRDCIEGIPGRLGVATVKSP